MKTSVLKFSLSFFIQLFCVLSVYAQNTDSLKSIWGIGVLDINFDSIPIVLYNTPNGQQIGSFFTLNRDYDDSIYNDDSFVGVRYKGESKTVIIIHTDTIVIKTTVDHDWGNGEPESVVSPSGKEVIFKDYIDSGLKYYQKDNDFVKVFINAYKGGVWIKISELQEHYGKDIIHDYFSFLISSNDIMVPNIPQGLNLREQPSVNSRVTVCMKGERFYITFTGKTKGQWAEVTVEEAKPNSEPDDIVRRYKGWIKVVSDKGSPNVWFRGNIWGC